MLRFFDGMADPGWDGARAAIVTMVVGDDYRAVWESVCRANWETYAARHGFDLLVLTGLPDRSARGAGRSPAWQKLLILEADWARRYERVVWIDADIIIAPEAPDILPCVPDATRIGVCRAGAQLSAAERHIYLERLYRMVIAPENAEAVCVLHHRGQYQNAGLAALDVPMLNSGVFVASPREHRGVLAEIYAEDGESRLYEQPVFSRILEERGLVAGFTPRFNWSVHEFMTVNFPGFLGAPGGPGREVAAGEFERLLAGLQSELGKAYFLHFSGSMPLLRVLADLQRDGGFRLAG